ncbi:6-O-methylguanine DNA methyltransferase [Aspergillus bertholletiae]|uniref:Methylated-DNA--protein-cysteine methyltransferase n=1 Tax=Aspergillus bertholletiae TaxID=1226010 RepID=A0A5N7AWR6_9EURO|nr:6-O-methylguanine DNA methyltransferase [Aspergillus bertholletiae]
MAVTRVQQLANTRTALMPSTLSTSSPPASASGSPPASPSSSPKNPAILKQIHRIKSHPALTPHRRRVYLALLAIPAGRWTTYSALAKHLNSSARAIGTAMRTNPFAPDVPCHRVLSADGGLGGYMGAGPASGHANLEKKRAMLQEEGVGFEWVVVAKDRSKGRWRAKGECFMNFPS